MQQLQKTLRGGVRSPPHLREASPLNSHLRDRYRFDLFSDPAGVHKAAEDALAHLRDAAKRFEPSGEARVLLPTLRLAIQAAEHILSCGLADNRVGGDDEIPLHADKMAELSRALNRAAHAVEMMEQGRGPEAVANLRGDVRIGYGSPADGSDQPFCLYVPGDYDPARKWPFMVRLHGMWSEIDEAEWTIQTFEWDREFVRCAPRGGFIELYPWGRGNEGYRDAGLQDVLDTMSLVEELFSIDERRVYLMGSSMGAAGAWRIAARFPERFAALCGVVGVYDLDLAENLRNMPVMFHYGERDDPKRVLSPKEVGARLRKLGGVVELVAHPESGHRIETTDYQLSYYRFFARRAR